MTIATRLSEPPTVSGADPEGDHLQELRTDPLGLLWRVRSECGDVGQFRIGGRDVVLLSGAGANEFFFRAPEEMLDQAEAYPFMKPIFGEGVVFDAPPERRREMLHNQALRDKFMRGHAETIANEVEAMVAPWQEADRGEIDLLDWFAELTIYTSSACLIGTSFRRELDRRFSELFHDLEKGTDAIAFVDPHAPIESFRRRDEARAGLVELVQEIIDKRRSRGAAPSKDDRDLLDVLLSVTTDDGTPRFSADEITGMFISMMFAGHHTTSGTAAWTLIELLRHPVEYQAVVAELEELYAGGESVSYQALREMPRLESAIKEALRLHPPLILLLRVAKEDLSYGGYQIAAGKLVGASPAVSNRLEPDFGSPSVFDPSRYIDPRHEETDNPWTWIPFGAGRHRCVGAAFAMMQLKAIFSVLLRAWCFELAQPPETYHNDLTKMVVQLARPCAVTFHRRGDSSGRDGGSEGSSAGAMGDTSDGEPSWHDGDSGSGSSVSGAAPLLHVPAAPRLRVTVDRDLCQGHATCQSEAPEVFSVSKDGALTIVTEYPADNVIDAVRTAVSFCPTHALRLEEV